MAIAVGKEIWNVWLLQCTFMYLVWMLVYVCTVQHINVGVFKEGIFFTVAQYSMTRYFHSNFLLQTEKEKNIWSSSTVVFLARLLTSFLWTSWNSRFHMYFWPMQWSFSLETVCRGSFHFLLQNAGIGLVRSKTGWKLAENDPCLWAEFISCWKRSYSETIVFSRFSSWKPPV